MIILNIQDYQERNVALELCKNLIEKDWLIPVIGSGFSFDTPTDNKGAIPSVAQLHDELFHYIESYSGYEQEDLESIKHYSLADLSQTFWNIYDRIPKESLSEFFDFIKRNFLNISFRKNFQNSILQIQWPYLFTLNYDTLIEDSSKHFYPIVPFDRINTHFYKGKTRLYKLHGDAKRYLETGDRKYFILSRNQYIDSLMNDDNQDMLDELLTAFSSKSILFYGCGLSEELDLIYSSQFKIKEKVKYIDTNQQAIIYISFESDEAAESSLSLRKQDQLSQYGITHILRIFTEEQSNDFFKELAQRCSYVPKPSVDSFLEKYSAVRFEQLQPNDTKSRDYLFQENLIWKAIDAHKVTLPGYYISRSKMTQVISFLSENEPLCFIDGTFYSGKTMFMIDIAKYYSTKNVYLFPSGINLTEEQLDRLIQKENALFCFDARSLSVAQIKKISTESELDNLKKNKSHAIIVIDTSDAPMYKYIFEARNSYREFELFHINSIFDSIEEPIFNKKIGMISLPPYLKNETLLDYIVRNERDLVGNADTENYFLEPQNGLLAKNIKKRIKALIMLATEIRIPAKRSIMFGIDEPINEMIKCCNQSNEGSVIEKDYSMYSGDSSGFEFLCNSKYWIIRALSKFANTQKNSVDVISAAYLDIIQDYRRINKDDDVLFYQRCEPYYYFDHIQVLFNRRWFQNSEKLLNAIYEALLPPLADSFQFLHQKAKGKLRIAQVQMKNNHIRDGKKSLKDALYNITRALQLAEMYPKAKNIEETILHMVYTQGRILIQFSCSSLRYVPKTVEVCFRLYQIQADIRHDAYDFVTGTGSDKKAFERFKSILISKSDILKFPDLDKEKVESLLTRWTGKRFVIINR